MSMEALTVEVYLKNLLLVCDEMIETLQKARLDRKEIDRWKQVIESYREYPSTVIYSDLDKYI